MIINCPQCHSRCRVRPQDLLDAGSRGKCPECGLIFIIPPGAADAPETTPQPGTRNFYRELLRGLDARLPGSFSRHFGLWLTGGLGLLLLFVFLSRFSGPAPETPVPPTPTPQTRSAISRDAARQVINDLCLDPLIGDGDLEFHQNCYYLSLLVTGKTPASYAAAAGRRFAHRLRQELPPDRARSAKWKSRFTIPTATVSRLPAPKISWKKRLSRRS